MAGQSQPSDFDTRGRFNQGSLREWVVPVALITVASGAAFLSTSFVDFGSGNSLSQFWKTLFLSDRSSAAGDVASLAEVLIGVLGLTLTVVAIVVQLAAQRYTPKLVDLFLADKVNILTFLYMVFAAIFCIWIIYSLHADYVPVYGNLVLMVITTVLLTMLIPYFRYVFRFLTPSNIIETIRESLESAVADATKITGTGGLARRKALVANGVEQITDIALSAVTQMDRNVALMAINTLCDILRSYVAQKSKLRSEWFRADPGQFISISSEFFDEIEERRVWVEARGLMDLELIFGLALRTMPDANSAIAANTRELALFSFEHGDDESGYLCMEYFNTFLRRAVSDNNQRAVFSLLYQYRRMAESLLTMNLNLAEEIVGFINYYGQQAMRVGLPFLKVVATMDICTILQHAYALDIVPTDRMLNEFLEIGESPELHEIPFAHEGVRKGHVILAAYLMGENKSPEHLKRIQKSLQKESRPWLEKIKNALLGVTKKKFWEITDRGGVNFEYIEPEMKESLTRFYDEYMGRKKTGKKGGGARRRAPGKS